MANLNETDQWEEGVYQLEENDPVLGGPGGIDNRAPRQLANRTRFQRLRSIAPWAETLPYPIGAYVAHAGFTWKSVVASTGVAPGTDAKKWARWGQTAAELQEVVDAAVVAHEKKHDPHPQYTTDVDFAAHTAAQNPHSQYATDADLSAHQSATDPHEQYALRSGEDVVPKLFRGIVITVLKPHLRQMVWDGAAYVRAPWHQPAMILYSYDNPSSIPGYLPIRADLSYSQANYPDLVARLGLSGGGTFSLVELRGEFIRCLDNGRGVNAGRGLRSSEAGDNRAHAHPVTDPSHGHGLHDPAHAHGAWTDSQGAHNHAGIQVPANVADSDRGVGQGSIFSIDTQAWLPTDGAHGHNVGISAAGTGITVAVAKTGIVIGVDGSEARPRNLAFPAWVSY